LGILKRNVSAQSNRSAVSIIARGNQLTGDLSMTGRLHVDGVLEGALDLVDDLSVGRQGVVRGSVRAVQVTVSGALEGELYCESLHIERGGCVQGNVCCDELIIDPKASFIGERRMLPRAQLAHLDSDADESPCLDGLDYQLIDSLPDRITLADNKEDDDV